MYIFHAKTYLLHFTGRKYCNFKEFLYFNQIALVPFRALFSRTLYENLVHVC